MALVNSDVKVILRQLGKDQLQKLARQKKLNKSTLNLDKPKLVEILSHAVKKKEIDELLAKHGRTGDKAVIDGMIFERKSMALFNKDGWKPELNNVDIPHMEFDIISTKKTFWSTSYILAECKNKPKVTMKDFERFYIKYQHYMKVKNETPEYCKAFMVTSGYFEPLVRKMARKHGITLVPRRR